jgi:hypothetical protein
MAEAMIRKALAGVREMDQEKPTPLLRQTYHDSIPDAVDDLGQPEEIRAAFAGFQKYLYLPAAYPQGWEGETRAPFWGTKGAAAPGKDRVATAKRRSLGGESAPCGRRFVYS